MTYAQCLADAQDLKRTMTKWKVRCSIELVSGRGSDPWASVRKYLRMHHHTASYYRGPTGPMTPILGLVKNGRSDLAGPLANGYGGYDLVYRIICMGLANHSGLGGPVTIDGVRVPKDSGRGPTWGTEWEGGYQDWAAMPGMLEFMGRADCALAEWSGRPITSQLEHSTWTTRKIDRRNFTRTSGIALSRKWSAAPAPAPAPPKPPPPPPAVQEDDMYTLIEAPDGKVYMNVNGRLVHMNGVAVLDEWVFVLASQQNAINDRRKTLGQPPVQILFTNGTRRYGDGKQHAAGYKWTQSMIDALRAA